MPTLSELESAEKNGTIGPKSKALLDQFRKSQPTQPAPESDQSKPGLLGSIARGVVEPMIQFKEHLAIPFQKAMGDQIPPGSLYESVPLPKWMGGPVDVRAPESGMQAVRQLVGEGLQTGATLLAPEMKGIPLWKASGRMGLTYGTGQAIETAKTGEEARQQVLTGAGAAIALGAVVPPVAKGIGSVAMSAAKSAKMAIQGLDPAVKVVQQFTKAIRPTVVGKADAGQIDAYNARAVDAVKSVVGNKQNLQLVDKYGELSQGKLPESLNEFTQAIEQTKSKIFNQYNALQAQSGKAGAMVDLTPIANEVGSVAKNQVVSTIQPSVAGYAKGLAQSLEDRKTFTPAQAQEAIAHLNSRLEAFYKNPSYESSNQASVDAMLANRLRAALDDVISKTTGEAYQPLKNQYGALSQIEKDVAHRAIVDARKNVKGLLDYTDIWSGSDVISAIAHSDPSFFATAAAKKGIASYLKYKNNPNVIVRKMFRDAEGAFKP